MFILIADDETMIRLSLQSMLEELYPNEHIYLHASNGKAVLTQIEKISPDIAFLDIRMPLMNGLEVLKYCRTLSPSTIWIILSGYADFEYAQKAIALSAYSYLLKPVDTATLHSLIDEITEHKLIETIHNNQLFNLNVIRSFNMADQFGSNETAFSPTDRAEYRLYQIYIDQPEKEKQHLIKQALYQNISGFCCGNQSILSYSVFFNNNGELCVICSVSDDSHLTFFIRSQLQKYPEEMLSAFCCSGDYIKKIYDKSKRIAVIADIRIVRNCRDIIFMYDEEEQALLNKELSFCKIIENFIEFSLSGKRESLKALVLECMQNPILKDCFNAADRNNLYLYLENNLRHTFRSDTFHDFIQELYQAADSISFRELESSFDILRVKDYVHLNFSTDLSISYVSETFNLSPTYFSRLFHDKTGQKYIDFVTEVRMENAARILADSPSTPVKNVAEMVGYSSVRHFSRVFQRHTGLLPSNYP